MTDTPASAPQPHTYDSDRDRWAFLYDSYCGGHRYRQPSSTTLGSVTIQTNAINEAGQKIGGQRSQVRSYLVAHPNESERDFELRVSIAAYVNIVAPIVKAYSESVTSKVRLENVPDIMADVIEDATRGQTSWDQFREEAVRWHANYGLGWTVVDAPRAAQPAAPRTVAAAGDDGIRPYVVFVHPPAVVEVCVDAGGKLTRFVFAESPFQSRDRNVTAYRARLRILDVQGYNGAPGWAVVEGNATVGTPLAGQYATMAVVDSGPLDPRLGNELPVIPGFYERDTTSLAPNGISLVDDAADIARLIFNALSWASEIHRHAGFPFLAIPLASTGGQLDPKAELTIGPGKGLGFNSTTGAPQYVQPPAESPRELREHCLFLFALALRSAGMEVAADSSAQVQSGEALRIRSRDFESRAQRFASATRAWELRVLRLLALYAGASEQEIAGIKVTYPKRFTLPDVSEDLARALSVLTVSVDLGNEAKLAAIRQMLDAALSLADDELDVILDEIRARLTAGDQVNAAGIADDVAIRQASITAQSQQDKPESFYQYELEGGMVTVNEWRATKGLALWDDAKGGNLTLPELRAKFPQAFAMPVLTQTSSSAAELAGLPSAMIPVPPNGAPAG